MQNAVRMPLPQSLQQQGFRAKPLGWEFGLDCEAKGTTCMSTTGFPSAAAMTIGPVHSSLLQALATTASSVDSTEAIRLISGRSDLGVLFREVAKPLLVEIFSIRTHAV